MFLIFSIDEEAAAAAVACGEAKFFFFFVVEGKAASEKSMIAPPSLFSAKALKATEGKGKIAPYFASPAAASAERGKI